VLSNDERDILNFLKCFPGAFVSPTEICRRAGSKHRYRENPRWAIPVILSLLVRGFLEANEHGYYRLLRKEEIRITSAERAKAPGGEEIVYHPEENLPELPPQPPPATPPTASPPAPPPEPNS
jgi:hypothetical protein